MIQQFEKLNEEEKEILLKAPALVSLLAVSGGQDITRKEKADAVKLAHIKTFSAHPLLLAYYDEVERHFKKYFDEAVSKYAPFDDEKRSALKKEIHILNIVIDKLEDEYSRVLHNSLSGYAEHVRKSDRGFLEDFIFPVPIHGIND